MTTVARTSRLSQNGQAHDSKSCASIKHQVPWLLQFQCNQRLTYHTRIHTCNPAHAKCDAAIIFMTIQKASSARAHSNARGSCIIVLFVRSCRVSGRSVRALHTPPPCESAPRQLAMALFSQGVRNEVPYRPAQSGRQRGTDNLPLLKRDEKIPFASRMAKPGRRGASTQGQSGLANFSQAPTLYAGLVQCGCEDAPTSDAGLVQCDCEDAHKHLALRLQRFPNQRGQPRFAGTGTPHLRGEAVPRLAPALPWGTACNAAALRRIACGGICSGRQRRAVKAGVVPQRGLVLVGEHPQTFAHSQVDEAGAGTGVLEVDGDKLCRTCARLGPTPHHSDTDAGNTHCILGSRSSRSGRWSPVT